jgi:molybdopterin converting factor small subunit
MSIEILRAVVHNRIMEVTVKLFGILRRHRPEEIEGAPHHPFNAELPESATVDDLRSRLGVGEGVLSAVAVNGESADLATPLHEGDAVSFFPPAAGG